MKLLLSNAQKKDKEFDHLVSNSKFVDEREFMESLWGVYKPYSDKNFKSDIAVNFHSRFWEMYLACSLIENGFILSPKSLDVGPDICIQNAVPNEQIWIEATAPNEGTGKDRVPIQKVEPGKVVVNRVPNEKIILRFRSVIYDKYQKYVGYLQDGIVKSTDSFIIGLNGRRVPFSFLETEIPYIVQSVLPFGDETITIDIGTNEVMNQGFEYRPEIKKSSGALISTRIFLDQEYSGIAGILYSNADLFNRPRELGSDFIFVHNPTAKNPMRLGWLPVGMEYWVENGILKNSGGPTDELQREGLK